MTEQRTKKCRQKAWKPKENHKMEKMKMYMTSCHFLVPRSITTPPNICRKSLDNMCTHTHTHMKKCPHVLYLFVFLWLDRSRFALAKERLRSCSTFRRFPSASSSSLGCFEYRFYCKVKVLCATGHSPPPRAHGPGHQHSDEQWSRDVDSSSVSSSLVMLVRVGCVFWGCLYGNLLLDGTFLNWDVGWRHLCVLGDEGPLHRCVGRHIRASAAHG